MKCSVMYYEVLITSPCLPSCIIFINSVWKYTPSLTLTGNGKVSQLTYAINISNLTSGSTLTR